MAEYQPTPFEGKVQGREFEPGADGSGMGIEGIWMNRQTGQKIRINQTVQDGDNMIIITDKGQLPMEIFSRDYIQVSDDIYDNSGNIVGKAEPTSDDVAAIAEYEKEFGVDPLVPQTVSAPINNEQIIKKVFDKLTSVPKIEVNVKWDNFPEAQINTLVEFLDVKFEDISAYIIKKYVNVEVLALELTDILKEKLHKNIEDTIDE
jgi:hypothetical protein